LTIGRGGEEGREIGERREGRERGRRR